jgi:DHA2 family multidrug resistance protein
MTATVAPRTYVAILATFLGAGIITLQQRLVGVGLPDLRGAYNLGFDEAAWIPTATDMGLMVVGPLTVYLVGSFGPRRVLLACVPVYALASAAVPLVKSYWLLLGLQAVVGLAAGTFYPVSIGFSLMSLPFQASIFGLAFYSVEILATLNISSSLQAWFADRLWSGWIFWVGPALAVPMALAVYLTVPSSPKQPRAQAAPSFRGAIYASSGLALWLGALEQGERLDWFHSPIVVALLAGGTFLVLSGLIRRVARPNPLINLRFLWQRNTLLLGLGLVAVRFVLLGLVQLVPGFLSSVQGYRPLEIGRVFLPSVVPVIVAGLTTAYLMRRFDGRAVAAAGFGLVGAAAIINAQITSGWAAEDFLISQLLLAIGLPLCFVALFGMVVQQFDATGLADAEQVHLPEALTFGAFLQVARLFGGQVGTTLVQRFVNQRELFHSHQLGYAINGADPASDERLRALSAGLLAASNGADDAQQRALSLLGAEVRQQATTLAYADGFVLIVIACIGFVLALLLMKPMKNSFDVRKPIPSLS